MAAALEAALGTACCWGLSPALDLHQHLLDAGGGDVTALLVGAAEGRHLLLTASRAHREPRSAITIFVAEQRPEAVARQLLFLLLATTEPPGSTGLRARATALLELLGSVRLRPSTARLLAGAAGRLRRWVTVGGEEGPPLEVELMKSRERDALEAVLRRWEGGQRDPPRDPPGDWDQRLRWLHGVRYDSRAALADWDLRMELHQRGATTVSPPEFALWRSSGVAFVPRGGGGDAARIPNPTLQSGRRARADGQPGAEQGFWGDIVTGPFLIFGLIQSGTHEKTATEISLVNVTALLWELHGGGGHEESPRYEDDEDGGDADPPEDPLWDGGSPLGPALPSSVQIRFLPLGSAQCPPVRAGLEQRCGVLVLGWRSLEELTPPLLRLAAPAAVLLIELPIFVPVLRPPQIEAFRARAAALAERGGFEAWEGPEVPLGYARFRRSPSP